MTNNEYIMHQTVRLVAYFCFNYPDYREVIEWIYQHQTYDNFCNKEHLLNKFEELMDIYKGAELWMRFFCELDGDHQTILADYITQVYYKHGLSGNEKLIWKGILRDDR